MSRRRLLAVGSLIATSIVAAVAVAIPAQAARNFADTDYVALGDSYSSGVGAPGQSVLCLRSSNGYPGLWSAANSPKSFRNVACLGAETGDVKTLQLAHLNSGTDLVSITIGGNDAGFASTVVTCTVADEQVCKDTVDRGRDFVRTTLGGRLDSTYAGIKRRAPNADVVVLGYPILFDMSPNYCGIGGLSPAKRTAINVGAVELNDLIKRRAEAAGFRYADVTGNFNGHGICADVPWINTLNIIPPTDSFHPNASGYRYGYLPALTAALR